MPLMRLQRDHRVSTWRGVEFWMADEAGSLVFCRISHDALRDHAKRAHFEGTDDKVFEAYQQLLEQLASDAFDAGKADEAGCVHVTKEAFNCAPRRQLSCGVGWGLPDPRRHTASGFDGPRPSVGSRGSAGETARKD
jgi:Protein of unknown function (DUF1488)